MKLNDVTDGRSQGVCIIHMKASVQKKIDAGGRGWWTTPWLILGILSKQAVSKLAKPFRIFQSPYFWAISQLVTRYKGKVLRSSFLARFQLYGLRFAFRSSY